MSDFETVEGRPVVFKMGTREQVLTLEDVRLIREQFVGPQSTPLVGLRTAIRAVGKSGGEVRVIEEWRITLADALDGIEERFRTPAQRALREALLEPILLTDQ